MRKVAVDLSTIGKLSVGVTGAAFVSGTGGSSVDVFGKGDGCLTTADEVGGRGAGAGRVVEVDLGGRADLGVDVLLVLKLVLLDRPASPGRRS